MCRLMLYLGPETRLSSLIVEPAHSLIRQSVHSQEREEPLNGDGFGIGWYASEHELRARGVPLDHAGVEQPQSAKPRARRRERLRARARARRDAVERRQRSELPSVPLASIPVHAQRRRRRLPARAPQAAGIRVRRRVRQRLRQHGLRAFLRAVHRLAAWRSTRRDPALRMAQALARAISRALELVPDRGRGQ